MSAKYSTVLATYEDDRVEVLHASEEGGEAAAAFEAARDNPPPGVRRMALLNEWGVQKRWSAPHASAHESAADVSSTKAGPKKAAAKKASPPPSA